MRLKLYPNDKLKRLPHWQFALLAIFLIPFFSNHSLALTTSAFVNKIEKINLIIKGKVVDEKGIGLPGVSVQIKGTAIGAVTDGNGLYTIS
ncbi:MAG: hypothetical protein EOP55_14905, partial [Sphingobacteriales bacterium]